MAGSGTTTLEAYLTGRQAIAFDIDPLALLLNRVKVSRLDKRTVGKIGYHIVTQAREAVQSQASHLRQQLKRRWDDASRQFINYWFAPQTQVELMALVTAIETIPDETLKGFFRLTFSATIITKTGGVSLALDLAHTRPHRAKIVYNEQGEIIIGREFLDPTNPRQRYISKTVRPAINEFEKRLQKNIKGIYQPPKNGIPPRIEQGNAQRLPLADDSIDLIVTSPLRQQYQKEVCRQVLYWKPGNKPSIADVSSNLSAELARGIVARISQPLGDTTVSGQTAGKGFESITKDFLESAFQTLSHLRPGRWQFSVQGNIIRNRKGHTPHIVIVTAEPMPTHISSLALGTGDIDCVYHFALNELRETAIATQNEALIESLMVMIDGNRLRDIADLPFDLAT